MRWSNTVVGFDIGALKFKFGLPVCGALVYASRKSLFLSLGLVDHWE